MNALFVCLDLTDGAESRAIEVVGPPVRDVEVFVMVMMRRYLLGWGFHGQACRLNRGRIVTG